MKELHELRCTCNCLCEKNATSMPKLERKTKFQRRRHDATFMRGGGVPALAPAGPVRVPLPATYIEEHSTRYSSCWTPAAELRKEGPWQQRYGQEPVGGDTGRVGILKRGPSAASHSAVRRAGCEEGWQHQRVRRQGDTSLRPRAASTRVPPSLCSETLTPALPSRLGTRKGGRHG